MPGVAPSPKGEVCSWPTGAPGSFPLLLALQSSVPQNGGDGPAAPSGTPSATTLCHHPVPGPGAPRAAPAHHAGAMSPGMAGSGGSGGRQWWQCWQWWHWWHWRQPCQPCQPPVPPRHGSALAQRIHHLLNQSTHSAAAFVINYANQHTITLR